jgi:hypothetical protein
MLGRHVLLYWILPFDQVLLVDQIAREFIPILYKHANQDRRLDI